MYHHSKRQKGLNRRGLSTVITTLIILVVSVMLAGVVTMYAVNITSTRTQQEQLKVTKQHIWVGDDGTAIAGFVIDNVGGKDVVITKVQVRGVSTDWTDIYLYRASGAIVADIKLPNATLADNAHINYAGSAAADFDVGVADQTISLASGGTLVVYIASPDNISPNDIGGTIGITVFTQNAQYYVECNVQTSE